MKKPKILSSLLTLGIAASLLCQSTVFAEETGTDAAVTATESGSVTTNSISGWPQAADISSEAAVVMENTTNTIL